MRKLINNFSQKVEKNLIETKLYMMNHYKCIVVQGSNANFVPYFIT